MDGWKIEESYTHLGAAAAEPEEPAAVADAPVSQTSRQARRDTGGSQHTADYTHGHWRIRSTGRDGVGLVLPSPLWDATVGPDLEG